MRFRESRKSIIDGWAFSSLDPEKGKRVISERKD
jgi:hypothetical protein